MSLSRQDVVDEAVRTLDSYGFADLTMRKLAAALDIQPSALYWHFTNKQGLLVAIAEQMLAEVADVEVGGSWEDQVRRWATGLRRAVTAHRDGAELVASVLTMRSEGVDPTRGIVALLHRNGLDAPDARAAAASVLHFVMGHAVDEQGHAQMKAFGVVSAEIADDPDARFDYGLELIVDGLRARVR